MKRPECDVTTWLDSGPHYGRLYCNLPQGHYGTWHYMCHPGTNEVVFYLIIDAHLHVTHPGGEDEP